MSEGSSRYERRDLSPRIVALFALGLALTCFLSGVGIWVFEKELNRFFNYRGKATWTSSPTTVAPPPRLQSNGTQDLKQMRAEEDVTLQCYQWVDRRHGVIRIPIDVAMKLMVERGLPVRTNPAPGTPKPAP
jgi:hypothetical protein